MKPAELIWAVVAVIVGLVAYDLFIKQIVGVK